jgi:WD40 repeat protein
VEQAGQRPHRHRHHFRIRPRLRDQQSLQEHHADQGARRYLLAHAGNINNIEWNTGSRACFVSSSFENYILQWDTRQPDHHVAKYDYSETTKIRDLKFNPHNDNYLAVQSSTKLELSDCRMGNKSVCCYDINDN